MFPGFGRLGRGQEDTWRGDEKGMVYVCEKCKFVFERQGEVTNCPGCGSGHIRPANEAERQDYIARKEQVKK